MNVNRFDGKVALQQRVFPTYRLEFFQKLSQSCTAFSLFAGSPRGDEAILTAQEAPGLEFKRGRNVHISGGKTYLCLQTNLLDWLAEKNPDVLILEANPRYLSNRAALGWMRSRSRPVLGWGLGAPSGQLRLFRRLRSQYLRRFDAMISYSTTGAKQYVEAGVPEERVFVAPNAVLAAPTQPLSRIGRDPGPMQVLFVGRLQRRKRVDLLIHACAGIDPKPSLTIVGDGAARDELFEISKRVLPEARFTGALQGEALGIMFQQADIFVLPGTGGLAAQQAMAHGLPIVIADGDGTQRDLVTAKNGWLVEPGNPESLIQALASATTKRDELDQMGIESYRIVKDRINIETMAATFVQALQAVTGE